MDAPRRVLTREEFERAPRHFRQYEDRAGTHSFHYRFISPVVYEFDLPFELVQALEASRLNGARIRVFEGYSAAYIEYMGKRGEGLPTGAHEGKPFGQFEHGIVETGEPYEDDDFPWDNATRLVLRRSPKRTALVMWSWIVKAESVDTGEVIYRHPNCDSPQFFRFSYTVVGVENDGRPFVVYTICSNEAEAVSQVVAAAPQRKVAAVFLGHHTELTGKARLETPSGEKRNP